MNDRIALKRDSAETEASVRSTEASAEASAESLAIKYVKNLKKKMAILYHKLGTKEKYPFSKAI